MNAQQPTVTTDKNGNKEWRLNGKLHRTDGPAMERPDGTCWWYHHGNLHRLDGPAVEYANGDKRWYKHSKLHRTDGPAVKSAGGNCGWWVDGVFVGQNATGFLYIWQLQHTDEQRAALLFNNGGYST